jgi:hypothetical protein
MRRTISAHVDHAREPDPQSALLTTVSTEELNRADLPIHQARIVVDSVLAGRGSCPSPRKSDRDA